MTEDSHVKIIIRFLRAMTSNSPVEESERQHSCNQACSLPLDLCMSSTCHSQGSEESALTKIIRKTLNY